MTVNEEAIPDVLTVVTSLAALSQYLASKGKTQTAQMVSHAILIIDAQQQELAIRSTDAFRNMAEELTTALYKDVRSAVKKGEEPPEIIGVQLIYKDKEQPNAK
jgi:hypothetical protein